MFVTFVNFFLWHALVNKLTSVFHVSILLLIMILSWHCQRSSGSADYFDNVMTKFIVNKRTDALKTDVNLFFTITNCQLVRWLAMKIRHWARANFCSYRKISYCVLDVCLLVARDKVGLQSAVVHAFNQSALKFASLAWGIYKVATWVRGLQCRRLKPIK